MEGKRNMQSFSMFLLYKVKGDRAVRTGDGFRVTKVTGYDKKSGNNV